MNNKFAFPNLIINQKEITIKEQDNIDISNDFSPLAFSFSLDQKIINKYSKIAKKNNTGQNGVNNKILNTKLIRKYNNLLSRKNGESIKIKLFNKATSTSDSFDNSFNNKEMKSNYLIKSFNMNKDLNDCLIAHNRIFLLNKIKNTRMNNQNKNNQNIIINSLKKSDSSHKYQTIFSKNNLIEKKDDEKPQELIQNFELLSSKYSMNELIKIDKPKKLLTPKNEIINKEINNIIRNTELQNKTTNEKYIKTEESKISKNNTIILMPKYVQMPNLENLKNFQRNSRPIFYCQKDSVKKNINLMIQNNKNEKYLKLGEIAAKFWNKSNKNNRNNINNINILFNKKNLKQKEKEKNTYSNGMKYSSINLNGFANIPNRLIKFDKHGNKMNTSKNSMKGDLSHFHAFKKLKDKMLYKFSLIKNKFK